MSYILENVVEVLLDYSYKVVFKYHNKSCSYLKFTVFLKFCFELVFFVALEYAFIKL